jgi:ribonuclease HI
MVTKASVTYNPISFQRFIVSGSQHIKYSTRKSLMTWQVYTDGGCPSNPGPGSWGVVIKKGNGEVEEYSGFLPEHTTTNNQCEYRGLEAACVLLGRKNQEELPCQIEFFSDSQLIVNQINGKFKVNMEIRPFYETAAQSFAVLSKRCPVSLTWIGRSFNTEADALCNRVLDKHGIVCKKKGKRRDD